MRRLSLGSIQKKEKDMKNDVLYDIETLQTIDIPIVAQILVDSFETNPCYSLIFRSKEKRRDGLFWLLRQIFFC